MYKTKVSYSTTAKSRGVFATQDIKSGQLVETCHLITLPKKDLKKIKDTKLYYYFFEYSNSKIAIVFGHGSLYNHSYTPNARYLFNYKNQTMKVVAIKDIKEGSEIFVNYNYYPEDKTPLEDWYKENI